jgi:hypothetical protein
MKKFLIGFLIGIMVFSTVSAAADIVAKQVNYPIYINGKAYKPEKPVVSINGSTYLALRDIGNALDVKVAWNDKDKSIEIEKSSENKTANSTISETTPQKPMDLKVKDETGFIDTFEAEDGRVFNLYQAKSSKLYNSNDMTLVGETALSGIERFYTSIDQYTFTKNQYYLVIDFSIVNIGKSDYIPSLIDFELTDSSSYTYEPSYVYEGRGKISGIIKPGDMKRGEIAFVVPGNETQFELKFDTRVKDVGVIRYKIDVNSIMPKQDNIQATPDTDANNYGTDTVEPVPELDPMQPIDQ